MAKNLAVAGFKVSAWNRTASKAAFLKDFQVEVETLPSEAVQNADLIISMLSDGKPAKKFKMIKNYEKIYLQNLLG